jgi:hypothetical protein
MFGCTHKLSLYYCTVSILSLTFIEVTVGETKVRLIANTLVITTGIFAVFVYNATGEINSGTPVALITFQMAHSGRFFINIPKAPVVNAIYISHFT